MEMVIREELLQSSGRKIFLRPTIGSPVDWFEELVFILENGDTMEESGPLRTSTTELDAFTAPLEIDMANGEVNETGKRKKVFLIISSRRGTIVDRSSSRIKKA
ncbi:hypothetical protein CEXT_62061 [Caerostris extrusa]|uniref:Uncharacterized protein n=1 Tax=Caerostris extrusa TaxID=172846 RepID=A0AAV4RBJ5_CAEEX|nr:hypothetical protein CEXT_62061 [Caerostris extrusa]